VIDIAAFNALVAGLKPEYIGFLLAFGLMYKSNADISGVVKENTKAIRYMAEAIYRKK